MRNLAIVFVEDYEGGDNARHPSATGQQKYDKNGSATAVKHGQWRKNDGKKYSQKAHSLFGISDYGSKIVFFPPNGNGCQ